MNRPCLRCGELSPESYCPEHRRERWNRRVSRSSEYGPNWTALSRKCRKLQPWCTQCGSTEQLETHHTVEAWLKLKHVGALTFSDAEKGLLIVLCHRCNVAAGAARIAAEHEIDCGTTP